jgi:hypothetical protein
VGLPKVRGLWCSSARNCSRCVVLNAACGGPLGHGGAPWQGRQPLGIEGVEDVADRLIVASQSLANHAGGLATGTGE